MYFNPKQGALARPIALAPAAQVNPAGVLATIGQNQAAGTQALLRNKELNQRRAIAQAELAQRDQARGDAAKIAKDRTMAQMMQADQQAQLSNRRADISERAVGVQEGQLSMQKEAQKRRQELMQPIREAAAAGDQEALARYVDQLNMIDDPKGAAEAQTKRKEQSFTSEKKLRDEYNKEAKDFKNIARAFNRVKELDLNTPAGQMALIFNYMKMLDPNSVVRESEFRTAADLKAWLAKVDTGDIEVTIPSQVLSLARKGATGEFLLPMQVQDFADRTNELLQGALTGQEPIRQKYLDMSSRYGLDSRNIVTDFIDPEARIDYTPQGIGASSVGKKKTQAQPSGRFNDLIPKR